MRENFLCALLVLTSAVSCGKDYLDPNMPAKSELPSEEMATAVLFTVSQEGKQVEFSSGNLYYDGSEFRFEERQYDYPSEWDENHIGHFYFCDCPQAASDVFFDGTSGSELFANNDGVMSGYTTLTNDEWSYLIKHSVAVAPDGGYCFVVCGVRGVILTPDGFHGQLQDMYEYNQWSDAEKDGLVFLPFTGYRQGRNIGDTNQMGRYWAASGDNDEQAFLAMFDKENAQTNLFYKNFARSIRLVKSVTSTTKN